MIVTAVGACGLPRSGPNKKEIFESSVMNGGDAHIVSVTAAVARAVSVSPTYGFSSAFRSAGLVGSDTIAAGDTLGLTVFENVRDDPLLGNTGQRVSALDQVQVDGQGYIFVPYAGRIRAAGLTPEGLRAEITRNLDSQTPDPQVTVQRLAGDGSTVSVTGSANVQGVYPITQPTRTLTSMLAAAGGVNIEPTTALIRVTRGGQTGQIWLQDLYDDPGLDIALRPGDQIVVERDRRNFIALGATGQTVVPFERQDMSALEALATVGGLATNLADPTGVFVFRDETQALSRKILGRSDIVGEQRMVYVLDLTEPSGMFQARDFLIRDGDTIYVTEAPFVQWTKTIQAITGTAGAANTITNVGE
ncbi:polysaccharide biosynthesis/export family protein [Cereibacter sp. SYSU M97828]|nr:polysaccharide biosynthesis/export family protein [Cereibacter flavus]